MTLSQLSFKGILYATSQCVHQHGWRLPVLPQLLDNKESGARFGLMRYLRHACWFRLRLCGVRVVTQIKHGDHIARTDLAGDEGIEPSIASSKPAALPLG